MALFCHCTRGLYRAGAGWEGVCVCGGGGGGGGGGINNTTSLLA